MTLKLFNTASRSKQEFKPLQQGKVGLYSCGPTVYDFAHIGNFRSYIFLDLLRRYLEYLNYKVNHVMNVTDVDDKTINGSQKEGIPIGQYTQRYAKAFFEDLQKLNIELPHITPYATEYIKEMVAMVQTLLDKGVAYKGEDGSIYYSIRKFPDYGKFAHLDVSQLKAGARVSQDAYTKDEAYDFALWKAWTPEDGDVFWETPIGKGRPGWHIECSAMSMKHLGETFDIHTGGIDLVFPHHQNEIAQSEAATGKRFVNYWVHCEHLLVDNTKMSKSLGNFYTLRDVLGKGYSGKEMRYLLLSTHYRQKLNFTWDNLEQAKSSLNRLLEFMDNLKHARGDDHPATDKLIETAKNKFEAAMNDDLNISEALAAIFELVKEANTLMGNNKLSKANANSILKFMDSIDHVLGVLAEDDTEIPENVKQLVKDREQARRDKDWAKADELRDKIKELGFSLDDTQEGTRIKKI